MASGILERVRSEALTLSESERAELAHDLVASLDGPPDADAEPLWEAEILRTDRVGALSFVWNTRTTFVANMQFGNSTILKHGARVEVRCHRPLFGRPFVSRVMLLSVSNRVP